MLSLIRAGVPEAAVRAYVEAQDLHFPMSAEDVVQLNEAGAGVGLLVFLLERARPSGDPPGRTDMDRATLICESRGMRAFRTTDARGRETILITNLDDGGFRTDRPADAPPQKEPPPPREPSPEPEPLDPAEIIPEPPSFSSPPVEPPPEETRRQTHVRTPRGTVYVGPFYQFAPSNVPGPNSPWSPVFQILPVWAYPCGVPVYPFARLAPVYPPTLGFGCRR